MRASIKDVKKRMQEQFEREKARCKDLVYYVPDLKGPGGNAFNLIGNATALMKNAGITESVRSVFSADAMSSDYAHVLDTIQDWFTVAVHGEPVLIPDGMRLTSLMDHPTTLDTEGCIGCGRIDGTHAKGCTEVGEDEQDQTPKAVRDLEAAIERGDVQVIDLTQDGDSDER